MLHNRISRAESPSSLSDSRRPHAPRQSTSVLAHKSSGPVTWARGYPPQSAVCSPSGADQAAVGGGAFYDCNRSPIGSRWAFSSILLRVGVTLKRVPLYLFCNLAYKKGVGAYIYVRIVCVCMYILYTHAYTFIYIYIVCICIVCMYVCM